MKKIVVKVPMTCGNSKSLIFQTVSKLDGIKSLDIDEDKGTLTVVGTVDPVCIIAALRKKKIDATIDSVGEDKKPETDEEKKRKECEEFRKKITECCGPYGLYGPCGQTVPYTPYRNIVCYDEPQTGCIIS